MKRARRTRPLPINGCRAARGKQTRRGHNYFARIVGERAKLPCINRTRAPAGSGPERMVEIITREDFAITPRCNRARKEAPDVMPLGGFPRTTRRRAEREGGKKRSVKGPPRALLTERSAEGTMEIDASAKSRFFKL